MEQTDRLFDEIDLQNRLDLISDSALRILLIRFQPRTRIVDVASIE